MSSPNIRIAYAKKGPVNTKQRVTILLVLSDPASRLFTANLQGTKCPKASKCNIKQPKTRETLSISRR